MNFFEGELRKLLGDSDVISDPSFAGRACLGTLGKDLRVRLEFVTTGMADHYNALKIKVLNRTEGEVDTLLLRFQDVWEKKPVPGNPNFRGGVSPHIWICDGKPEWYAWRPAPADRELLLQQVRQYLEPFRERMPERGHDGPKLVYICAPLRGDVANNIEFARQKAQEVFQSGDIPVCPHITLPSNADPACSVQDEAAREMGLRLCWSPAIRSTSMVPRLPRGCGQKFAVLRTKAFRSSLGKNRLSVSGPANRSFEKEVMSDESGPKRNPAIAAGPKLPGLPRPAPGKAL